jgi:predicted fused transcriptional regulator/phosphomethylpyrimidine kinase/predicted transcriptional regulator
MMDTFLPAIRMLVCKRLTKEGLSQSAISKLLGVTQASVSNYLSEDGGTAYSKLAALEVTKDEADAFSRLLAEDALINPVYATDTLVAVWNSLLARGRVCPAHRERFPSLSDCDICLHNTAYEGSRAGGPIESVSKAVKVLEESRSFVRLMPEVSVNMVYCPGHGNAPSDVVGVPGRIARMKNAARAMSAPEYGGSTHLARILLIAKRHDPAVGAALNVRYDAAVKKIAKRRGLRILEFGGDYPKAGTDPVAEALAVALHGFKGEFDAVADRGGRGLEPNLYIFGKEPVEVAKLAASISREYGVS